MEIKPLDQHMEGLIGERIKAHYKKVLTYDWIFSSYLEKGLVTAMFIWSLYSLGKFLWSLL